MRQGRKTPRGIFITLEGVEGSGKTTQGIRLATRLRKLGYRVLKTREPGGTPLAEHVRRLLLESTRESMTPESETLLILASRSQHVDTVIQPALQQGFVVLCDRFLDSTLAYQGYARGIDRAILRSLNRFATRGLDPDLTLLFDLPVSEGLLRRGRARKTQNRLDLESHDFHRRVRRGYLDLAAACPRRIKVIRSTASAGAVANQVSALVLPFLRARGTRLSIRSKASQPRKAYRRAVS